MRFYSICRFVLYPLTYILYSRLLNYVLHSSPSDFFIVLPIFSGSVPSFSSFRSVFLFDALLFCSSRSAFTQHGQQFGNISLHTCFSVFPDNECTFFTTVLCLAVVKPPITHVYIQNQKQQQQRQQKTSTVTTETNHICILCSQNRAKLVLYINKFILTYMHT